MHRVYSDFSGTGKGEVGAPRAAKTRADIPVHNHPADHRKYSPLANWNQSRLRKSGLHPYCYLDMSHCVDHFLTLESWKDPETPQHENKSERRRLAVTFCPRRNIS